MRCSSVSLYALQFQQVTGAQRTIGTETSSYTSDLRHGTPVQVAVCSADRRVGSRGQKAQKRGIVCKLYNEYNV